MNTPPHKPASKPEGSQLEYFDSDGYPLDTCSHMIPVGDHCCDCDEEAGYIDACEDRHYGWDYDYNEVLLP